MASANGEIGLFDASAISDRFAEYENMADTLSWILRQREMGGEGVGRKCERTR